MVCGGLWWIAVVCLLVIPSKRQKAVGVGPFYLVYQSINQSIRFIADK